MISNNNALAGINTPVRHIGVMVELYNGSTLINAFTDEDIVVSVEVTRAGDASKFIGYGICQKLNVKLIDTNRELDITTANTIAVLFGSAGNYVGALPRFKVTEVHRDENTNQLSVTAYDTIYSAAAHRTEEIELSTYTIGEYAAACAALLGVECSIAVSGSSTAYPTGANFSGTETIRDALNAIAEATQSIYYMDSMDVLTFKNLDINGDAVLTIDKSKYIKLDSSTNRRLSAICHATELGDNVIASLDASGTTQYIRNNPFWDLREDIADLVNAALDTVGGLTINQFNCNWRGNYLLEIGDKISLVTKDNDIVTAYLLDDVIKYDGAYTQVTKWSYSNNDAETAANPTTIGDAIKQTYARVDKVNNQIELVAGEAAANSESISNLLIDTDSITATITRMEHNTQETLDGIHDDISELTNQVSATMTAEDIHIAIQTQLDNGVDKVTTNTGFTFNDEGLTVSKSDSEMTTTITEDGMIVYRNDEAVLTANNEGVEAVNLLAKTYLIIGTNSRFENYGENRTGCFWIGE